jgi:hypothetical protein
MGANAPIAYFGRKPGWSGAGFKSHEWLLVYQTAFFMPPFISGGNCGILNK